MLKVLRHKGVAKKVLWVVSGIIIISFGFGFGMSSYSSKFSLTDAAGKAFGKKVSIKDFRQKYLDSRDQAMMMYGDSFSKVSSMMDLDNEAWTRLLLVKEADQRKIKATDPEVIAYIASIPLFQIDSEFDRPTYETMLKHSFQRDARAFEEGVRDQIKIMKLFRAETMGLNVPDETVRKEYERRNQKVSVDYVLIDPKNFIDKVTVTDQELQEYFNARRQDFLEPDSVKLQYAIFPIEEKAAADTKKIISEKARAFYLKTKSSDDFSAAAKTAGAQIKETGFFNMEQPDMSQDWPLELMQKIFEAKAGDILKPEETASGIQVIKILARNPAFIPEFAKAKTTVKDRLLADRSLALAKDKAVEVYKTLAEKVAGKTSFDTSIAALNLTKKTTPFFALGDYVPEIGISEDFASAAFALNKDQPLSNVVHTTKGPAILYWEALQPIDEKKFTEVKKDFSNTLYEEQRVAAMNRVIKEIKEKAGLESYLDKIKK
ncbi:MAG: peptidyl-prolyl cis-trans isomerase [Candidatus Omnitrophica bacterium]|nr:peptidyl-prolyl cis-trans isomerase [Candidatus Omnitrophota bacterium]